MLIRCLLVTLREVITEYELDIDVELVKSHDNRADQLTRVLWRWLEEIYTVAEPKETVCAVAEELDVARIQVIHWSIGQPDMKRMLYFVKLVNPRIPRTREQAVVRDCRECLSIDPAPVHWKPGMFDVSENWSRVGMDVSHLRNQHYLMLIDRGPSRFAL